MGATDSNPNGIVQFLGHPMHEARLGRDPFTDFIRRLSPGSQLTMRYALQQVARLLGVNECLALDEIPWHMIEQSKIQELVDLMRRTGYSERTVDVYLNAIRGVLSEAHKSEMVSYRKLRSIYDIKTLGSSTEEAPARVDETDIAKLLMNCDEDWRLQGFRDGAMIALLSSCGFGRQECVDACLDDLDLQNWSIGVSRSTGLVIRRWIAPGAVLRLSRWLEIRDRFLPHTGPLFNRIRKGRKLTPQEAMDDSGPTGTRNPGQVVAEGLTAQAVYFVLAERSKACGVTVNARNLKNSFISSVIDKHGVLFAHRLLGNASPSTMNRWASRPNQMTPTRPTWSF